jgi:hypothetical protein
MKPHRKGSFMNVSFRRAVSVLAFLPFVGCGGGDSPTGPKVTGPSTPQKCRRYATGLAVTTTSNSPGASPAEMSQSCTFDTAARALRCTTTGSPFCATSSEVTTYPSIADFIEEAEAVGRRRSSTIDRTCDVSTYTDTHTYDAQKRLVRLLRSTGSFDMTFTAWDALGRPTQSSTVVGACLGTATLEYDDTARTLTWRFVPTGSDCDGSWNTWTEIVGYDGIGSFVNYVYTSSGFSTVESRIVGATAEVCI